MILVLSILVGLISGVIRARANQVDYDIPPLRWYWLALVGFLPQYLIFYSPLRGRISDEIVGVALIISQILLLGFALVNMNQPGFWLLGFGLLLNLTVILANGGFMPISPDTVHRLLPEIAVDTLILGERFGTGKDIILPVAANAPILLIRPVSSPNLESLSGCFQYW